MIDIFTDAEITFSRQYVQRYQDAGYPYYVAQTVNERNNVVDLRFYFSKEPISFRNQYSFSLSDGICIDVDTSNSYDLTGSTRFSQRSISGSVSVGSNEDIFTNGVYAYTSAPFHPALDMDTYELKSYFLVVGFVTMLILFFHAVSVWLRGR